MRSEARWSTMQDSDVKCSMVQLSEVLCSAVRMHKGEAQHASGPHFGSCLKTPSPYVTFISLAAVTCP